MKIMKKTLPLLFLFVPVLLSGPAALASGNGSSTDMPAYYDHELFVVNFFELPSGGEQANQSKNVSINTIYMSDALLSDGSMFVAVLDAIQTDGFNPLWEKVLITFNPGHSPEQFFSDDQVLAAAAAGKITLTDTDELYRCAVVGTALP